MSYYFVVTDLVHVEIFVFVATDVVSLCVSIDMVDAAADFPGFNSSVKL